MLLIMIMLSSFYGAFELKPAPQLMPISISNISVFSLIERQPSGMVARPTRQKNQETPSTSNYLGFQQKTGLQARIQQVDVWDLGHKVLFELEAVVSGGVGPFSYQWTLLDNQAQLRGGTRSRVLSFYTRPGAETQIQLRVTDSNGVPVTVTKRLIAPIGEWLRP